MNVDSVPHDDEISLFKLASFALRGRRWIFISTFIGVLIALVFALRTPLEYTATASFLSQGGDQGGLSGAIGLAQQFGFSVPRSSGNSERSPEFYQGLLLSRKILDEVIHSGTDVLTPNGTVTVSLAEHFKVVGETVEQERTMIREKLAGGIISVSVARETGVITLNVRTDSPGLSSAIGLQLLDQISAFDLETRRLEASAERGFAEERLGQLRMELSASEDSLENFLNENRQFANSPQLTFEHDRKQRQVVMRQELVTAMAQAYEQARINEVRNTPVITIIDEPEPPALPDPRGRLNKLLQGLILGVLTGFVIAFIKDFGDRAKNNDEAQAYDEFQEVLKDLKSDPLGFRGSSQL
jgi:uncharacterized protein involved in exopolysaccharide biosynthesis